MTRRDRTRRSRIQGVHPLGPVKVKRTSLSRYFHTRINVPHTDSRHHPGTDFYAFVNGIWYGKKEIPSYLSTIGASEEIEETIRQRLWSAISHPSTPLEKSLHQLVAAGEKISIEEVKLTLLPFLKRISSICDSASAAELLGCFARYRIPSLLPWSVEVKTDGKLRPAADKCFTLGVGVLGLPEVDYYKQHSVVLAYTHMIDKTSSALGLSSPMHIAVPLESKLSVLRHAGIAQAEEELPTSYTAAFLQRAYSKIPWVAYWKGVGVEPRALEADASRWLTAVESCFTHWSPLEWKAVLTLHLLLWILPHLSAPFDSFFYEGLEKPLTGQREPVPRSVALYDSLRTIANRQMSKLFTENYHRELMHIRPIAQDFIRTIVSAAKQHVTELEWMSPHYKTNTHKRLESMTVSFCSSTGYLKNVEAIPQAQPFLSSLLQLSEETSKRQILRLTRDDPPDYWTEAPYTVNAFYYHSTNQIIIPAANFFWPFFDGPERIGWNYGGLGSIIAHEITHSFDDSERDDWTPKNTREVTRRSKALIRLFNREKVFGRRVHGQLTITETMADLAGLKVALDACKNTIRHLSVEEQRAHLREFFISYAVSWRTKEHPSKQFQRLLVDFHAPPRLRVNLIVNHFQDWYELFDVKPGHALYLPPSKRIQIL